MRTLPSLLLGSIIASSVYAAEPTLHTIPDTGYSLLQENADKALKVAYIVMGDMCQPWKKNSYPSIPGGKYSSGGLSLAMNGQIVSITITDYFDTEKSDTLSMIIYPPGFTLSQVQAGKGITKREEISDGGIDGRVNKGYSPEKKMVYNSIWDQNAFASQRDYFQEKYVATIDAIITTCEAKQ